MRGNRLGITTVGLTGLALVLFAATHYRAANGPGVFVCGLIVLGLVVGIGELVGRDGRAVKWAAELAKQPRPATQDSLASLSTELRGMLDRALTGRAPWGGHVGFAPFLVGVFATLGLLGTFLGVVDALAGARAALAGSGEIDALRVGLAAPIDGLTLAFGTSVAGVGASLSLGLAMVLGRRTEARLQAQIASYASTAMGHLAAEGRVIGALEALAERCAGLPDAVVALQAGHARLERLVETVSAEAAAARVATVATFEKTAQDLSVGFKRDASQVMTQGLTEAMTQARTELGPLVQQAMTRIESMAAEQRAAFTQVLDVERAARKDERAQHAAATTDHLRGVGQLVSGAVDSVTRTVEQAASGASAHADATQARVIAVLEAFTAATQVRADLEETLLAKVESRSEELATRLHGVVDAAHERDTARLDSWRSAVDSFASRTQETTAAWTSTLEQAALRTQEQLVSAFGTTQALMESHLGALAGRSEELVTQVGRVALELDAQRARIEERSASEQARIASQLAGEQARIAEHLATEQAQIASRMAEEQARLASQVAAETGRIHEFLLAEQGRLVELAAAQERGFEARLQALGAELSVPLAEVAATTSRSTQAITALAERADAGLKETTEREHTWLARIESEQEGWARRFDAVLEELGRAADGAQAGGIQLAELAGAFTDALDRHEQSQQRWAEQLTSAGKETAPQAESMEVALGSTLDQLREVFGEALEFQRQLYGELRALRGATEAARGVGVSRLEL